MIRVLTKGTAERGGGAASTVWVLREGTEPCGWNWAEATTQHYLRVIVVST